jgi:cytoskeletal protein CcmA (bactofilin family)
LFVWGGQVEISGSVGRDVIAAGGQVRITSEAQIEEDVNMAGGQLYVDSAVGDDVRVGGGTVNISGDVVGDVIASGGMVTVDEDLVSGEVSINEDYEVDTEEVSEQLASIGNMAITIGLISKIVIWLGMFLVGMVFIWLAPVKTKAIVEKMSSSWSEFMNSVLIGFVAFLPMVVGPFVLMVTVVGIPLSLLVLGALGFMAGFGILWGDMAVGNAVAKELKWKDRKYMKSLAIGRILRVLLCWIPVIGGVYKFVIFLASLGAMVRMKMDFMKRK